MHGRIAGRTCRATAAAEAAARAAAGPFDVTLRSDDNEAIRALVGAGLGVSLVPSLLVDARDERLVALEVEDELLPRRIALVWHGDRDPNPMIERIVQLSHEIAPSRE